MGEICNHGVRIAPSAGAPQWGNHSAGSFTFLGSVSWQRFLAAFAEFRINHQTNFANG